MRTARQLSILALLALPPAILSAQGFGDGGSGNVVEVALVVLVILLIVAVIFMVANQFLSLEARLTGAEAKGGSFAILPGREELVRDDRPRETPASNVHKLQQGFDVNLLGDAEPIIEDKPVATFGVQPPNFIGMSPIPKVVPEEGTTVKAGDVLFFDKKRPEIKYTAPVSGEFIELNRGAKRAITSLVILADREIAYRQFDVPGEDADRQAVVDLLLESGVWPMLRQRPYNSVPDPQDTPKSIFVSTFDTAPLAPDLNLVVEGNEVAFQKGLDVLARLTPGKVFLGLDGKGNPHHAFRDALGVEKHYFSGKHPAGNVGVHIHHVDPVSANQVVWTAGVQEVITIGNLFLTGRYDPVRLVALTGAEFDRPRYVRTRLGAKVGDLVKGEHDRSSNEVRLVSGDALSGAEVTESDFVNFHDDQLTAIEEGNYFELFGWLLPINPRPSRSGTFPNKLFGSDYKFKADTNSHGEKRAFVVTGEYEAVLPMDVLPQHLMKAIMVNDFERMEGLGIYELVEEDIAICEFACTSKQPLQRILRQGLEVMREQG